MIMQFTRDIMPSVFLVTTSHFSGVETITCVSWISYLVIYMSPVSSRTLIPRYCRAAENLSTISDASAFRGAMYMILNCLSFMFHVARLVCVGASGMLRLTSLRIVMRAILVLPAPVGAATNKFLDCLKATG